MECTRCNQITNLESKIYFSHFICPKCYSLHKYQEDRLDFLEKIPSTKSESYLNLGKTIVLENKTYCIANFVIKKANENEYWTEYELVETNTSKKKFLVEENGNWIISEEIQVKKDLDTLEFSHDNINYEIFEKGFSTNVSAAGFFDYKFSKEVSGFRDYINPPNVLSVENEDGKSIYYLGRHLFSKDIKTKFGVETLPSKDSIGIVEPFYLNLKSTINIFCIASIIVLLFHLYFYQTAKNQMIYQEDIDLSTQSETEISTQVFKLNGPIAPLEINLKSNVDNSWVATDFSLINQKTGEIAYFTKDLELYSGYEGGENWVEGSQYENFTICGVSSGKYKISIKPTKDPDDNKNSSLRIEVNWDKSNNWNFILVMLTFLTLSILLFYLKNNFEIRRWFDSVYSSYNKD